MASSSPGAVAVAAQPPPAPGLLNGAVGHPGGQATIGGPVGGPAVQLRAAAARGDLQEVVRLLGEGAKILPDEEGRTALHFSASAGHADIAAALIIAGAGVNTTDSAGCTALQRAAAEGHLDLVQQLLKHRADVNQQDNGPGNTALHEASWKGFSRCVQALCAVRGADLSLRNHAGFAPLHLACQNGHNQSCRELLLAGCDPDVRNNYGDTPLHTSARYGHAGVTRILVSAECKVSEQNKNGDTALHIAAAMGRRKLTRILLEAGCTKSLRNKQGETARDIATRKELSEILAILNSPVIPMPRNKEAAAGSKNSANNKRKHKKASASRAGRASGRASGRGSGSRSGSRTTGTGTPAAATATAAPGREAASGAPGGAGWSPYGCHYYPDTTSFPQPRLDSLPAEPLRKGEQYYLDLAGNIRKGPVGVGYTCYCAPFFRHMEQRLDRDKQDLKRHINQAVEGLERRLGSTQGHISHLTRSLAAERARCSQRHLHLQQWLRGVGVGAAAAAAGGLDSDGALAALGVPRARSVDSLLERPPGDALRDAPAPELADDDVGEEIEVLSEGDNTARRKESFLRRGGRGKLPRPRRGLDWDVLAEADKAMAATDPSHGQDPATAHPLLSAARLHSRATTRHDLANLTDLADVAHPELEVLDERVSRWRGQQRRLMLEVARASREIAQLKKVTGRDRIRERGRDRGRPSSGASSELESRNGRDSRGSRGSKGSRGMAASARRLQTLDQVDEAGGGGLSSEPCAGPGYGRSAGPGPTVQYLEAEVHAPPKAAAACSPGHGYGQRSRSQELLRVEPVAAASRSRSRSPSPPAGADPPSSPSPTPVPCSGAARAGRWHGVSVTAEDIENWRRLDRLREAREAREAQEDHDSGMINNPDYEVQVEDGIIFSSDLRDLRELRLPPLPQPQQPTAAMRGQPAQAVELPGPARALSSAPPPAAAVLHPKPKFGTPFEVVPFPRSSPATASASASAAGPTPVPLKRAERAAPAGSAHVPLRKSVHDMVARIQNHMLGNLIGRQHKSKEESAPTSAGPASGTSVQPSAATPAVAASPNHGHREMAIDVGDCVQVQARRVQACHREDDSESSDGEEVGDSSRPGLALGVGLGLGPDYENVACWRDDRHLVSELPYRSRTAVYSPDVDPDFLDIPLTNGHGLSINGHGLGINGHGLNGHGLNGHSPGLNVHEPDAVGMGNGVRSGLSLNLGLSPAGTPDLELEVHSHHPFHHHYPYTTGSGSGMYSPDHGDSGYSTRLGGSSNSKGTSPSLSGLDSDGLMQNAAPRSAAALNIANAAAAIVHQRHTNASLV